MDETEFFQVASHTVYSVLFLQLSVEFHVPAWAVGNGMFLYYFLCYVCHVLLFYGVTHFRSTQNRGGICEPVDLGQPVHGEGL